MKKLNGAIFASVLALTMGYAGAMNNANSPLSTNNSATSSISRLSVSDSFQRGLTLAEMDPYTQRCIRVHDGNSFPWSRYGMDGDPRESKINAKQGDASRDAYLNLRDTCWPNEGSENAFGAAHKTFHSDMNLAVFDNIDLSDKKAKIALAGVI